MHGGDIYRNQVKLDFSVNVNPLGVPAPVADAMRQGLECIACYPDIACEELKNNLSGHFGISEDQVLCGNGASELILAICRWKQPKKALLLAPGFSGYGKALETVGCETVFFTLRESKSFRPDEELLERIQAEKPDLLFFTNPSNPTGVLMPKNYLTEMMQVCLQVGTTVVLDECFVELTEAGGENSMVNQLSQYQNLMILRAFTKSFAIPGIRLGYLLCGDAETAAQIAKQLPEWNVSIPAQMAGVAALQLTDYLTESRNYIASRRRILEKELVRLGCRVFPSEANYILFSVPRTDLKERLLRYGILIRDCRDYRGLEPGFYRVAVKTDEEQEILLQCLKEELL